MEALRTTPLASHQERLWFIDEFERDRVYAGPPTYHNIPIWLWIDGPIDIAALQSAVQALVARHEALRTRIQDGQQHVYASVVVPLVVREVGAIGDEALIDLARRDAARPFLLAEDALLRATLYRVSPVRSLLAFTAHHIIVDRRSTGIMIDDLVELYRASLTREQDVLPAPGGYPAYAAWQHTLPDAALEPARAFWRWQLAGGVMPLELPYVRERPRIHVYAPAVRRVTLDHTLTAALEAAATREAVSLPDLLLSAFIAVLLAYARQPEIVVGTSHPNREPGLERMVGPLANLLVLRVHPHPRQPFRELVSQVRRTMRHAVVNRALPFDRLVQELRLPRDMSRTALFDVLYQYVDDEPHVWRVPDATFTRVACFTGYGKYDLALTLHRTGERLSSVLEYNTELFDDAFIDDVVTQFNATLTSAAADVAIPLWRLLRLPEQVAARQSTLLKMDAGPLPAHQTLDAAFGAVAARGPDRVAIVCDDLHVSYRALAAGARRVRRALIHAGVLPGMPVAVICDRTPDAIVAILGVLATGAAYVPVDPSYPPLRIAMLLEDSGVAVAVASTALADSVRTWIAERPIRVIDVEGCASAPPAPRAFAACAGDVAYSIYTSGSTGRPKGCLVTHRNVVQLMLGQAAAFAFTDEDVWAWSHSFSFDFSVWEIFGALLYGGRGILLSRDTVRDPALVERAIVREQITVLNQTPAAGYRFAERTQEASTSLRSLRWLVFGGDVLTPKRLERWAASHPHVGIVNMYGITETTVHVTRNTLTLDAIAADSRSVGRPLPNVAVVVVDEGLELVPTGALGELAVAGDGVSLGYWGRPELTAERFVPDPFTGRAGARLYRSGDEGRLRRDGAIAFHGRRDRQVKIRGHRVELGEIEKALADHAGVLDAAVILREDPAGRRTLAAFVTMRDEAIAAEALRRHLQERLTPAMIPAVVVPLPALPRTATGKIDRRALAAVTVADQASARAHVAASTDRERLLVRIWEEVLARASIGITDDFFEIGGDSILCMQICARAARAGLALAPKQLFEHPTIQELAAGLGARELEPAPAAVVGRAPLLPAQAWFFAQGHAEPNHFNQAAWFTLAPGIDTRAVHAVLERLRARHDALRLVFVETDRGIEQEVLDDLPELPLTTVSKDEVASAVHQAQRGLDIHRGPLFRALVVESADGEPGRLFLVFHHLIVDTVSWHTLIDDLDLLLAGDEASLAPPSSLTRAATELAAPAATGAPLPVDRNTFEHYEELDVMLDASSTAAIAATLARERLGWEEAILASAGHAVREWTGHDATALYFESHGRDLSRTLDSAPAVGWFMKLHRIPVPPAGVPATTLPIERVRAVRDAVAAAKSAPDLLETGAAFAPGLCVNYVGQLDALSHATRRLTLAEGDTGCAISPNNRRAQLIDLHAVLLQGRLRLRWGYSSAFHRRDAIERLASACTHGLRALRSEASASPGAEADAEAYPVAPGQLGMLYHALLRPHDAPEYMIRSIFKIDGPLDVEAYRASWLHLIARHDALRASFSWDGADGPLQRFAGRATVDCPVRDWRGADPRLDDLLRAESGRPINLAAAPLLSLQLLRIGEEEHYALLNIHHLIVDGWSLAILRDELIRTYRALARNHRAPLPLEPAGSFRQYLQRLASADWRAAEAFWRQRLRGIRPCALRSTAHAGGDGTTSVFESRSVDVLDRPLVRQEGLAGFAARHRVTLNTIVQGLWSLIVGCLSDRTSIVMGVVVAGRPADIVGIEYTVGTFINTLPLPVVLDRTRSLSSLMRRIQSDLVEAQAFAWCSLPQMATWAGLSKEQALFDTVLVCENYPAAALQSLDDLTIREVRYSIKESVPLVLEYALAGRLVCRLRYRPDLVNGALVREAAALLTTAVDEMTRDPELSVGTLTSRLVEAARLARGLRHQEFAATRREVLLAVKAGGPRSASS